MDILAPAPDHLRNAVSQRKQHAPAQCRDKNSAHKQNPAQIAEQISDQPFGQTFAQTLGRQTLGRIGSLETRLAANEDEIIAAQKIRYRVFVDELGARLPLKAMAAKRDFDQYDDQCEHLLIFDRKIEGSGIDQIVGTYRLMPQNTAKLDNEFYSQSEYDVQDLVERHPDKRFLELGRSCVLPKYRTRRSIELLWQGIWAYCLQNQIDVMFGCASFYGTVPAAHAQSLSFLYHFARAREEWHISPQSSTQNLLDLMPQEALNTKDALLNMPPLIKGYLRLGALFSPHAYIDRSFNTTDVLIILPLAKINPRYINHYGAEADRFSI